MYRHLTVSCMIGLALMLVLGDATAASKPEGQLVIAFDTSIAPTYLDPADTPGTATPFTFLYALHDALVKPLPGNDMAPSLAESWRESDDGLTYEFKLREGLTFHNGDPFTADDVKFSFLRYKGTSAKLLHERVQAVEVLDPYRVRFVLQAPWPDFMAFYGTIATGAAWIVPKKYIEQIGDDAFKQKPVGLGPYRFVRMDPGVELVLEAQEHYWRQTPSINRLIFKGIPERTTRLAMLKNGEADIAYLMIGDEASAIKADPKLRLAQVIPAATWWLEFPEQWDPKSPWHDRRVRLAAALALDKQAINEVERLGFSRLTGSMIPSTLEFSLPLEPYAYNRCPGQASVGRGRLSQWLRRGGPDSATTVLYYGRGGEQLSGCRGHPHQDAHYGACCVLHRGAGEEAARAYFECLRRFRQCRHPYRDLCAEHGSLCLWGLCRYR